MIPALYLIPVTLGETQIDDVLPPKNKEIISQIKYFIVENRRSAIRFLKASCPHIDIDSLVFFELNEHTDQKADLSFMLEPLANGKATGVISEAGCPAVGDPGALAVELAHKKNLRVIPLAGPSSMILAVMSSGFNGQNFAFNGYLPAKPAERASAIHRLEARMYKENQTQLFIEAPYRNDKMFQSLISNLRPETRLCVAAGLTTDQEFVKTKKVSAWKKEKSPEINKIPAIFLIYK